MTEKLSNGMNVLPGMADMFIEADKSTAAKGNSATSESKKPSVEHHLEEMSPEERKQLTNEQLTSIDDSVRTIRECSEGLQVLLLNPDGTPVDFADKEGRKKLCTVILNCTETFSSIPADTKKAVTESIPKSFQAHLYPKDQEFLRSVARCLSRFTFWRVLFFIITAVLFFLSLRSMSLADARVEQANMEAEHAKQQAELVKEQTVFGYFMSRADPQMWSKFEHDEEFRKSLYKMYGYK